MDSHSEENTITAEIIQTIRSNNFDAFKKLVDISPEKFRWLQNDLGLLLLREIIRENQREMFLYILEYQDTNNRKIGLKCMLDFSSNDHEYYVYELLKDRLLIHEQYKFDSLLQWAIGKSWLNLTKFLLESGVDPNLRDKFDNTPLHNILLKCSNEDRCEFVSMLLYYGADPSIQTHKGYNAFELALQEKHPFLLQEILHYTFDKHTHLTIFSNILLELAKEKSTLFYEILSNGVEVVVNDTPKEFCRTFHDLLTIDLHELQLLLERHSSMACEIFEKCSTDILCDSSNVLSYVWKDEMYPMLGDPNIITNLDYLYESSEELRHHIQNFCTNLDSLRVFNSLTHVDAHKLIFYLLTRGLTTNLDLVDTTFEKFGYCPLFKLLLHIKPQEIKQRKAGFVTKRKNAVVKLIWDVNTDLEIFFRNLDDTARNVEDLLNYFAHPELMHCLLKLSTEGKLSEEISRQLEGHPRVPRLVELSRNVFRKYLVKTFTVGSTRQFYSIVNALPISRIYKNIITLETKLY
ncbi:hypothetical protein Zmor_027902 [Zophobas morio]|uniref:SOCS box domain-containing protein n=1 Tax=Zophobas morio TaxID=2755281 RepID=A0AA38M3Q7_9CUCU|nr:hypothetical protein Zmor_027902 [Zophobas morio]